MTSADPLTTADPAPKPAPLASTAVRRALNIADLQTLAHRRIPRFAMDYVEAGADTESTLARNRTVFEDYRLVPRTLVDVSQRDIGVTLLDRQIVSPLVVAPTGFNGLLRRGADSMIARAAARAGIPSTLSTVSNELLENVATASLQTGGHPWFQLYMLKERSITEDLLLRARAAGYETLVLTTDAVAFGHRQRDLRNFSAPRELMLGARLNILRHPAWLLDVLLRAGPPDFANLKRYLPADKRGWRESAAYVARQMDASLTWRDVVWLRARWPGKLLVKGITTVTDALQAQAAGADGVVLSNHGGRQLDSSVSPLEDLAAVRQAVGQAFCVMIDSGFRRGADVVKALALGANAVMLGRPVLYGVAAGGEAGVLKAFDLLCADIDRVLGQLGLRSFAELGPEAVRRPGLRP